jgi:hypothetical protein
MNQDVIFWVFIAIFSVTAVITLLGITNVIKVKYLKWFVTGLILEVVALVITWGSAGTMDYSAEIDRLWNTTFHDSTMVKPENEVRALTLIAKEIEILQKGQGEGNPKEWQTQLRGRGKGNRPPQPRNWWRCRNA